VHLYAAQCAGVFRFCYIEIIQLRAADCASGVSFIYNLCRVSTVDTLTKILERCLLADYVAGTGAVKLLIV